MITKIDILPDDLQVHFSGENSEIFPNIWLRDHAKDEHCLLYTSPSPRDKTVSRMPSSA